MWRISQLNSEASALSMGRGEVVLHADAGEEAGGPEPGPGAAAGDLHWAPRL